MRKNKKNDIQKLKRFLEELTWLLNSYADLDIMNSFNKATLLEKNNLDLKSTVGHYESSNPNKQYLVGVLPRLFMDTLIFPSNDDIAKFSESVLKVKIPHYTKKSKFDMIGHVVCKTTTLNEHELSKLVKALSKLSDNEQISSLLIQKRKHENFQWNEIIQELLNEKY